MKMPIKCPVCNDVLLNEYLDLPNGRTRLTKTCNKRLGHNIEWEALDNSHDAINKITVSLSKKSEIIWYVYSKHVVLINPKGEIRLPYFDPEFHNCKKLMDKVKTYVVFS
jgi:hypothetical protein